MRIVKRIASALAVLCVIAAVRAVPALAYVDYPRTDYWSNSSAAWEFLLQYGGMDSSVPEWADSSQFVQSVVSDTSSPFFRFVYNYVQLVPAANWNLTSWRVLQGSDFTDFDQHDAYDNALADAVDYIENEWEIWSEEYPSSGGDSSVLPTGGRVFVNFTDSLGDSVSFQDGSVLTFTSNTTSYRDDYNNRVSLGQAVFMICSGSGGSVTPLTTTKTIYHWVSGTGAREPIGDVGVSIRFSPLADAMGLSDPGLDSSFIISPLSPMAYVSGSPSNESNFGGDFNTAITSSFDGPSGYYTISRPPRYYFPQSNSSVYLITNSKVWAYGSWTDGQSGPGPAPSGPTAPDYETPEPYEPTTQQPTTIVNNVTNNTYSYTGSETDYSDYLKIIIDNQKEQIRQIRAFSELVYSQYNSFASWIFSAFEDLYGYLRNLVDDFGVLLDWQKSTNGYVFDIRDSLQQLRIMLNDRLSTANDLLLQIFNALSSGSGPEGEPVYPDVTVDPGDDAGGFFGWLLGLLSQIVDLLIGSVDDISGLAADVSELSGVFPFSIPWDLAAILGLLVAEPVADYVIQWPILDGATAAGGVTWSLAPVDLSAFSGIFSFIRFGFLGLVAIGLAYKTKDVLELLGKVVG